MPFPDEVKAMVTKATAHRTERLTGTIRVPGDKSISHRSLLFGALAIGETTISGLLEGEDVIATADAMRAMGVQIERTQSKEGPIWRVYGVGVGGLQEPAQVLDMGNSGTGARLLSGVLATSPFTSFMIGDASLSGRPMKRVIDPLSQMGATFVTRSNGRLPMAIQGTASPMPITYVSPVASAQVKSAVMLAGLQAPGRTTVIEPAASRDHSERMLRHFGAEVLVDDRPDGSRAVTIIGEANLIAADVAVPGDISSASFLLVAGLLAQEGLITVEAVGNNPLRNGLVQTLIDMGADLTLSNNRLVAGEPVCDITVKPSKLQGIDVPPERAPSMIDEYPVLAVAASFATGKTRMTGLEELRVKESDRIASVVKGLRANGVAVDDGPDWMTVTGTGQPVSGGGHVAVHLDHRIAMAFLVMGTATTAPVTIDAIEPVATSFPGFLDLMTRLGAHIDTASPS